MVFSCRIDKECVVNRYTQDATILLAIGNSDVPVGQYTQKIFAFYDLNEDAAKAFLEYLTGPEASEIFEAVGFTPIAGGAEEE